jgi:hypothetical protein
MNAQPVAKGFGLPDDRQAQLAARSAFVQTKACFAAAAADVPGHAGAVLFRQVRQATEVAELWPLRAMIITALPPGHARTPLHRQALREQLEALFPDTGEDTAFAPL